GEFAVAVYDFARGVVTLASDPFGTKPLHFAITAPDNSLMMADVHVSSYASALQRLFSVHLTRGTTRSCCQKVGEQEVEEWPPKPLAKDVQIRMLQPNTIMEIPIFGRTDNGSKTSPGSTTIRGPTGSIEEQRSAALTTGSIQEQRSATSSIVVLAGEEDHEGSSSYLVSAFPEDNETSSSLSTSTGSSKIHLNTGNKIEVSPVFEFDLRQFKKTTQDWRNAFQAAVARRLKYARHRTLLGLSSGYDSGLLHLAYVKHLAQSFHSENMEFEISPGDDSSRRSSVISHNADDPKRRSLEAIATATRRPPPPLLTYSIKGMEDVSVFRKRVHYALDRVKEQAILKNSLREKTSRAVDTYGGSGTRRPSRVDLDATTTTRPLDEQQHRGQVLQQDVGGAAPAVDSSSAVDSFLTQQFPVSELIRFGSNTFDKEQKFLQEVCEPYRYRM
ncbi:unnamed protein product, partial [Amoebophrya sp. A25]